ncbi:MAG: MerR family transcriptional regulator [Desulfuromonadales bacterium]
MTYVQEGLIQIGRLAKELDITTRTIRYYEEIGLMGPSKRSRGGARSYNRDDVLRIKFILKLKELGISLKEMLSLADTFDTHNQNFGMITPRVLEILDLHIGNIDDKIGRLTSLRNDIVSYRKRISDLLQSQSSA